jgi:thiosulfate/3-mercaptopyruvate sulfurtransferase
MKVLTVPVLFVFAAAASSRDVSPFVSTDWLAQNLSDSRVVVLDIRTAGQFKKGHIPGSLNTPLSLWAVNNNGLSLELPSDEALRELLGKSGISPASIAVVVTRTETDFSRADATRVAWTCIVAGVKNVAVLDGGFNKWAKENRTVSTEVTNAKPTIFAGAMDRSTLASKRYVLSKIGKSILVDARTPEDYFGVTSKPGHIKGAVNMPTPWVFSSDGTLIREEDLRSIAAGVLGTDKSKEVIVYCGVGGYASTWWFVLTQMLGYRNVKLYDGSMEEWLKDPSAPVSTYSWH